MDKIVVQENQSLRDIAIASYGTMEAIEEILNLNNESLVNDKKALSAVGIDYVIDKAFYLDVALEAGLVITIDPNSRLIKRNMMRDLNTPQTKYEQQWQEQ